MLGEMKMKILHPEYQLKSESFFDNLVTQLRNQKKSPEILYHYTPNFEAIKGIAQKRELWLTNIAFLNDVSELDYIKSLEEDLDPVVKSYLQKWGTIREENPSHTYIMSFSEKSDYLPLWATFTKMRGYCIGFDKVDFEKKVLTKQALNINNIMDSHSNFEASRKLALEYDETAEFQGSFGGAWWHLCPVIYDRKQQVKIMNTLVKDAILDFEKTKNEPDKKNPQSVIIQGNKEIGKIPKDDTAFENAIDRLFNQCATLFKSEDFSYEREWRYIKEMTSSSKHLLRHLIYVREVDNVLIPYIKLKLQNDLSFGIKEIISAPLADSDTILPGLDFALFDAGYEVGENGVLLKKSNIKLRRF